ncbi:hypothetical protein PIROE2DRAFT_10825 [Piromyces sp. E2]|nr:hypothetical protein PIROE2DRAFT_10825 [Piromyces sp. E2]|eukprot:OUM62791.1 hypothetical protein PIROE2DRAFT_10825 [Piromyces sp. E2]
MKDKGYTILTNTNNANNADNTQNDNLSSIITDNSTSPTTDSTTIKNNKVESSAGSKLTYFLVTAFVLATINL